MSLEDIVKGKTVSSTAKKKSSLADIVSSGKKVAPAEAERYPLPSEFMGMQSPLRLVDQAPKAEVVEKKGKLTLEQIVATKPESSVPVSAPTTFDPFEEKPAFNPLGFGEGGGNAGEVGFSVGVNSAVPVADPRVSKAIAQEFGEAPTKPVAYDLQVNSPIDAVSVDVSVPAMKKQSPRDQRAELASLMIVRGQEIEDLMTARRERKMDVDGALKALSPEDQAAHSYYAYMQETGKAGAHLSSVAGAMIPGGQVLKDPIQKANEVEHPYVSMGGNMIGMIPQAMVGGSLIAENLAKVPALAKTAVGMNVAARTATGAALAVGQIDPDKKAGESAGDVIQNAGAGAVSVIPELLFSKVPAAQLVLQPATDLIYSAITDAARGRNVVSKEWLMGQIANAGMGLAFAGKDVLDGAEFTANSQRMRGEIAGAFKKRGDTTTESAPSEPGPTTAPGSEQPNLLVSQADVPADPQHNAVASGNGVGVIGTKRDLGRQEPDEDVTDEPAPEIGWRPNLRDVMNQRGDLSDATRDYIVDRGLDTFVQGDHSDFDPVALNAELEARDRLAAQQRARLSEESESGKPTEQISDEQKIFATELRAKAYQELGGKSNNQWSSVAGMKVRLNNGELNSFDPATQKYLDKLAESWNEGHSEGIPQSVVDRFRTNDNWHADDVAMAISHGMNAKEYRKWQSEARSRQSADSEVADEYGGTAWDRENFDNSNPEGLQFSKGEYAKRQNQDLRDKEPVKQEDEQERFLVRRDAVRDVLVSKANTPITNRQTGITATLSRNSIDKILSGKAIGKSHSSGAHFDAAEKVDSLFENAVHTESEPDKHGNQDVVSVHKFVSPFESGGKTYSAKVTVKEFKQPETGNRIYSVEAVEIVKGLHGNTAPTDAETSVSNHHDASPLNGNIARNEGNVNYSRGEYSKREDMAPAGDSDGTFSHSEEKPKRRLKMPELVELAKALTGGKLPKLAARIAGNDATMGAFSHPKKGAKEDGEISLRLDLFADPEQAEKTLAHEIGHADEWAVNEEILRNNPVANRIIAMKGDKGEFISSHLNGEKPLTDSEIAELKEKIRNELSSDELHEVEREITDRANVTVDDIRAVLGAGTDDMRVKYPQLYDYLARANTAEKKSIVLAAMKGMIPDHIKAMGEIVTVRKEVTLESRSVPASETEITNALIMRMDQIAKERDLIRKWDITNELKLLTQKWRPFDPAANKEYSKYRFTGEEMYADAISALLNEPDLVQREAPNFWKAYHGHIELRPEMKAAYEKMTGDYETVMADRSAGIREGFESGNEARQKGAKARDEAKSRRSILTGLKRELIDKNAPILDAVKDNPNAKAVRYALEDLDSQLSEVSVYVEKNGEVYQELTKNGLTWDDLGEIMFEERIINERDDIANPRGWTPEVAVEQRDALRTKLGDEKFSILEKQVEKIRENRRWVVAKLKEAGMFTEELQTYMDENPHYATYSVVKYLENRSGGGVLEGAAIHSQKGTLSDIDNPATATLLKDMALIREANRTIAAKTAMSALADEGMAQKVERKRMPDGTWRDPKPTSSEHEIVSFLQNGEPQFYEIDKHMAKVFNRVPAEYSSVVKGFRAINNVIKQAYVQKNPGFWVTNLIRDFRGSAKRLPGMGAGWELLPRYIRAISDKELRSSMLEEMKRNKMVIVSSSNHGFTDEHTALENTLGRFMPDIVAKKDQNAVLKFLSKLGEAMDSANEFVEQTSKIAGKLYLDEKTNMSDADKGHFVRTQVGSPDYNRTGSLNDLTNTFAMFYNARKEGWRADIEAFRNRPGEFIAKSMIEMIPTMIAIAAASGKLGEEVERLYGKVGSYHKRNFDIVPLGETAQGKAVCLRIPRSETAAVAGSLITMMAEKDKDFAGRIADIFTLGKDQIPAAAPTLGLVGDAATFATGKNVYDPHFGKMAVDEELWDANGLEGEKAKEAGKHLWNQYGGSVLMRFETDDIREIESKLEKATGLPVVGNPIGRLLLVTDGGEREDSWKIRKKEEGAKNAERWIMQKRIAQDVNGKDSFARADARKLYDQLKSEGVITDRSFSSFKEAYHKIGATRSSNSEVLEILSAGSSDQKDQIIENILNRTGNTGTAREDYKRNLKKQVRKLEAL